MKYRPSEALLEHMLLGNRVSVLEGIILFGVQDLPADIGRLRRKGYLVKSQRVSLAKPVKRINQYTVCKLPANLPYRDIQVTEYWISR